MEYPYSSEFPQRSREVVRSESIRAARDFDSAQQKADSPSKIELPLRNYILRVFLVFVREAAALARDGLWSAERVESESLV